MNRKGAHLLVFLSQEAELQVDVVELPAECAPGSFDDDRPALQLNLDYKQRRENKFTQDSSHWKGNTSQKPNLR